MEELDLLFPHTCPWCNGHLDFRSFMNKNKRLKLPYLKKLWKDSRIMFLCCFCYKEARKE